MQFVLRSTATKTLTHQQRMFVSKKVTIPNRIGVLGYGAIGKAFIEMVLHNYPTAQIVALDLYDLPYKEERFQYLNRKVTRDNVADTLNYMGLKDGDFLVDLSTNIAFLELWPLCARSGVRYLNTALEQWEDSVDAVSFPKNQDELYRTSLGYIRDRAEKLELWNTKKGPTAVLEMGMNPGLISHFVKKALDEASEHYLENTPEDIKKSDLRRAVEEKNHARIAEVLGVHTIHCSEWDNQSLAQKPKDLKSKLYNTWSCKGLLTEGLVPIQASRGSHEDVSFQDFGVVRDGKTIMSWGPSVHVWANSWVPNQNIKGVLIPHGEAYSINEYLHNKESGYSPSQYYVYDFNPYAKEFVYNLPKTATVDNTNPPSEVIHPMAHPDLRGVDKVGALLCMKNNRGWWTGSIMDDVDARRILNWKFGPTVLQVAAGVYSGFLWGCLHGKAGVKYPEYLDTDFIFKQASPYLGRVVSTPVDLSHTSVKDCQKLQSFLCNPPKL